MTQVQDFSQKPIASPPRWRGWLVRMFAAGAIVTFLGLGWILLQRRPPAAMPPIRWRVDFPNLHPSLGAVNRDGVLFAATPEAVIAMDRDGRTLWGFTNGPSLGSVATGENGNLYLGGYRQGARRVICLDSQGRFQWDQRAATVDGMTPLVTPDGTIVTSGIDRELHAFSPGGKPLWTADIQAAGFGPPLIRPDGSFVVLGPTPGPGLWVIGANGRPKGAFSSHRFTAEPNLRLACLGSDGTVYLAGRGAEFLQSLPADRPRSWSVDLELEAASRPVPDRSGRLVLTARDPKTEHFELVAVSESGSVQWRRDLGLPYADTTPAVGPDGSIYLTTGEPSLWCLSPGGEIRWKYRLPRPIQWAPPARKSAAAWTTFFRQLLRTPRAIPHTPALLAPDGSLRVGLGGAKGYVLQIDAPVR